MTGVLSKNGMNTEMSAEVTVKHTAGFDDQTDATRKQADSN